MLKHSIDKCRVCENYLRGEDACKYCNFEWAKEYPPLNDEFNIFELDDDIEWSHYQIMDRLRYKGIECISADIWCDEDLAIVVGALASKSKIADALGVSDNVVFETMHGLFIINLFMEKYRRGMLDV